MDEKKNDISIVIEGRSPWAMRPISNTLIIVNNHILNKKSGHFVFVI